MLELTLDLTELTKKLNLFDFDYYSQKLSYKNFIICKSSVLERPIIQFPDGEKFIIDRSSIGYELFGLEIQKIMILEKSKIAERCIKNFVDFVDKI